MGAAQLAGRHRRLFPVRQPRQEIADRGHRKPEGQEIVRRLAADADVLIENYKVGGLAKYGLDYASLAELNPQLVYCSVTGFGQDGPYAQMAGYDYIVQGMSGLMSITGPADGEPHKVGWRSPICSPDSTPPTRSRPRCGRGKAARGQHIDMALFDCALAMLANVNMNWLVGGAVPPRLGNAHPNIVPYQVFKRRRRPLHPGLRQRSSVPLGVRVDRQAGTGR